MSDSSAVDNALCDKLRDDATIQSFGLDGVFFGQADAGSTKFIVVSLATADDVAMFLARAYEDLNYLVKAVVLNDDDGLARDVAARIDEVLDPQPPAPRPTLDVQGYRLMTMRRIDRVRYPDPDPNDPSIVWQHRGGHYQVVVYPVTA